MNKLGDADLRKLELVQAASAVVFCCGFLVLGAVMLFGGDVLALILGG